MQNVIEQPVRYDPHAVMPFESLTLDDEFTEVARTRMDWGNAAHVLEAYAQHGGEELLEKYFSLPAGHAGLKALRNIEKHARVVFAK